MKQIGTRSTSHHSAICDPIVLREGERVRLTFVPALVDNVANPKASVDGAFVYQRKAKSSRWIPVFTESLASLREGDEFKLTLHADELLRLLEGLVPLYRFYLNKGIPKGHKTFVEVEPKVAEFISATKRELSELLDGRSDDTAKFLGKFVNWLATYRGQREAATQLVSLAPEKMPSFSALLGLASMKEAVGFWKENLANTSEQFWQECLAARAYVLSQVFAYPVVVIGAKAYVGGKQITSQAGKEVDFLLTVESTDALSLIEIKTPETPLLGSEYRKGVFPLSKELSSSVAQVLLTSNFSESVFTV